MNNPYKELSPYIESDADRFKGRSLEIEEMYDSFYRNDYLVCYADSGEGKSSIIEAGIVPKMRQNMYLPIHIVFRSDEHYSNGNVDFNQVVHKAIDNDLNKIKEEGYEVTIEYSIFFDRNVECLQEWEKTLIESNPWLWLRNSRIIIDSIVYTPVLIFDQFEEVFTNPSSQEWTDKFFAWLQELSTDICPKSIVDEILSKVGKKDFPNICTEKHYKCIFSLRSEYMGQLDYWGLQRHYIPLLKSNRYLLRPLTITGAREVITKQDGYSGLDEIADSVINVLRTKQKGKNYVEDKNSDLPCIPALFLSVICSQLFGMSSEEKSDFIDRLKSDNKEDNSSAIEVIIERFYEETIAKCDIPQSDMGIIEEELVNKEGNRQRISSHTNSLMKIDFCSKYLRPLQQARIIRVIPEYNRNDESIELIHDSLCPVINKKKEQRQKEKDEKAALMAEEAMRREEQRDDISSSFFLVIIFCFFVWFVNSFFCDRQVAVTIQPWHTIPLCMLANLYILPVIIYSLVKRLKLTSWLSIYGLLSNAVLVPLFFFGQDKEIELRTFISALAIGIPSISLFFSVKHKLFGIPTRYEMIKVLNSIPLLTFFGIFSVYIFYLSVFNTELGLPEPENSSWGLIVLPILLHGIISNSLRIKHNIKGLLILFILLLLICYNSSKTPFLLPPFLLILTLFGVAITLFCLYQGVIIRKRFLIVSFETIVLLVVLSLNLGFNYLKIDYNNVTHIYNWINATVEGDENKYGTVSACDGETIIPIVLDSIDYKKYLYYMKSYKHSFRNDTVSLDGCYSYNKQKGLSIYEFFYIPEMEKNIAMLKKNSSNINPTLQDSINTYAAIVYDEFRKYTINYFVSGKMNQRTIIEPLDKLALLQERELRNELNNLKKYSIKSSDFVSFNRAFAKTFCLCMLKDRIIQKDSVHIFSLTNHIPRLFFYDSLMPKYVNETNNLSLNINYLGSPISFTSSFTLTDLQANSIDAWHNYVNMLLLMHLGTLSQEYVKSKNAQYADIANIVNKANEKLIKVLSNYSTKAKQTDSPRKKIDNNISLKDALSVIVERDSIINSIENKHQMLQAKVNNLKNNVKEQISSTEKEKEEMEESFKKLIIIVFSDLSEYVLNRNSIYNGGFIDICEQLYLVSVFHQFETSPIFAEYLEKMYDKRTPFYSVFQKIYNDEKTISELLN